MHYIHWPAAYLPGTTDNFVSNEVIVTGLSAAAVWAQLADTTAWPGYYSNASDIVFHDGSGPRLSEGARFRPSHARPLFPAIPPLASHIP